MVKRRSEFAGFVRKSSKGNGVKVNLRLNDVNNAPSNEYQGQEMVSLVINRQHLEDVLNDEREWCSISYFVS